MEGGSDSTSIYLQSFILMLVAHPDVQAKARAEIDSVVGLDRLPDIEDMDNLPYVSAVIKEVSSSLRLCSMPVCSLRIS